MTTSTSSRGDVVDDAAQALGLRETQLAADADALRRRLRLVWEAAFGDTSGLRADLDRLKRFFDPVATGARLRRALAVLPAVEIDQAPPLPCAIPLDDNRFLITPEGRCALELLVAHGEDVGVVVLRPDELQEIHLLLLETYRAWSRHRLEQVLGLLHGDYKPLQVPAAAMVLALLVNRNTAPERALARVQSRDEQRTIDETFFPAVDAFASEVWPSTRRSTEKERLIGGWRLHEAVRRAPDAFALEPDRIFIRPGHEEHALDFVADELARRPQVDVGRLTSGFDRMVDELRRRLPRLDTLGLAFERPLDTERARQRLIERFVSAREQDEPNRTL